jgi:lipoprotein-anchoring transpeptidase ErfK/SrfK
LRQAALSARRALLGSVAVAFVTGALLPPVSSDAAVPGVYPNGDLNLDPGVKPNPVIRPRPVVRPNPTPSLKSGLKPKPKPDAKPEPARDFGAMPKGPLQIVVSIADQHVTLYSNGVRVAQGPVSTGVPGRPTPTGVFSIIQKDRFHHSNLYSNAPMPYMERITWSGVALHEGPLPGYPASHGCIRMTHDFAARLWVVARLGVRVVVARNDVVPADFTHPRLFEPKAKPSEPPVAADDPEKHAESVPPANAVQAADASPDPTTAKTVETLRGALEVKGPAAPAVTAAVPAPMPAVAGEPAAPTPAVADPPKPRAVEQPAKHAGTVAVLISRKEKKLFVRQGFAPLFDTPVEIENPDQPFGTHVFTALGFTDSGTHMRWNAMSVAAEPPRQLIAAKIGPKRQGPPRPAEVSQPQAQTAAQVLDRIKIPQEALDRIGEILSPGASLVISDQGLGPETGEGTDFIVLTR